VIKIRAHKQSKSIPAIQRQQTLKKRVKTLTAILVFIIIFGALAYGMFYLYTSGRPTPATAEQMENALSAQGFQPMDITETAMSNFSGAGLENCIVAGKDDMRFEFYRFDNVESAQKVFQLAYSQIIGKRTNQRVEYNSRKLHYRVYVLDVEDDYYLTMYAENTAVYAYCDSENSGVINTVLNSLGYIDASGENWHSESPFDGIIRVAAYALWIPVMYIVRFWIWPVLCKSAGVTRKEALELGESRKEIILKLIKRSPSPKQTRFFAAVHRYIAVPAYIVVIFSLAGCFTDSLDGIIGALGIAIPVIMACEVIIFSILNRVIGSYWKRPTYTK